MSFLILDFLNNLHPTNRFPDAMSNQKNHHHEQQKKRQRQMVPQVAPVAETHDQNDNERRPLRRQNGHQKISHPNLNYTNQRQG
jgi:hypothetical protein